MPSHYWLNQAVQRSVGCGLMGCAMTPIVWGVLVAPVLAQTLDSPLASNWPLHPQTLLLQALAWVDSLGIWGGLAFIGIYALATIAFLPGTLLTLGAGVIFGIILGSVYVLIGATIGAILAFLVGRYLARDWVRHKMSQDPKFAAIDAAVAKAGLKIVVLTRLSPLFPFNALNYAFGVTGVSLRDYSLGSIGMIPGTIMYVYIGFLAGDLARLGTTASPTHSRLQWAIWILGLIATIAVTVYVTHLARQALVTVINDPKG